LSQAARSLRASHGFVLASCDRHWSKLAAAKAALWAAHKARVTCDFLQAPEKPACIAAAEAALAAAQTRYGPESG
jgi:hypothetical protein